MKKDPHRSACHWECGRRRAIWFRPRKKSLYFYEDRQWYSPFAGGSHEFLDNGEQVLDDRILFHYMATGITPGHGPIGSGSRVSLRVYRARQARECTSMEARPTR